MENRGVWRGKRVDNGELVEGYYSCITDDYTPQNIHSIMTFIKLKNGEIVWTGAYAVDPSTLGECTGLRDKNGKLIFEWDICTATNNFVDGEYGVVKYCEQEAMFIVDFKSERLDFSRQLRAAEVEVIGNIHDTRNC